MGLPAVDRKHRRSTRPRLRLIDSRRRSRRTSLVRARELFLVFGVAFFALAVFGVCRVALAARAFDDALAARHLEEAIKAERLEGDLLEVDKSALATPSRIENVAGATMQMAEAGEVCYIAISCEDVGDDGLVEPGDDGAVVAPGETGIDRIVSAVKGLAAEEVQSLLVGDVGLASSK
ncbi:MAG: hypothetical protein OEV43_03915 [Coriobacteriia bacterium]|nr:hypothetical protein [Coriobacteriia bacterium]